MEVLKHLNIYFGYEATNMKEFIQDFKEDFEGDENGAMMSLLMFLNSYSKSN